MDELSYFLIVLIELVEGCKTNNVDLILFMNKRVPIVPNI
jgi:hypothetical protein